ncbi:MAG: NAD+ synthase [Thaumarchaeota archaeon]|nr:NAD+ synthase [Nitrososphaerota archaeon]
MSVSLPKTLIDKKDRAQISASIKAPQLSVSSRIRKITEFIKNQVSQSGAKGIVLGISGGIDSAVTAALCTKALGPTKVTGVLMFEDHLHNSIDFSDAKGLIRLLRINNIDLPISPMVQAFESSLRSRRFAISKITSANIKARSRMVLLYSIANERNLLVAGTGDKSEIMEGYFTKFGDGAADILPIAHLYKTEVRALGETLKLPVRIITKPSSPNLWSGQVATEELPADYDVIDRVLSLLNESRTSARKISQLLKVRQEIVNEIIHRFVISEHKRKLPASVTS